jgi:hypothetical protein
MLLWRVCVKRVNTSREFVIQKNAHINAGKILSFPLINKPRDLYKAVREGGLPMVNMRDNAEISYAMKSRWFRTSGILFMKDDFCKILLSLQKQKLVEFKMRHGEKIYCATLIGKKRNLSERLSFNSRGVCSARKAHLYRFPCER